MAKSGSGCISMLRFWAQQRGVKVHPARAARGLEMKAPHSELCMQTRCAGKSIRAFALNRQGATGAIAYSDATGCHFVSGADSEVIPYNTVRELRRSGLAGARRRRK
jgi:hypothetical protein